MDLIPIHLMILSAVFPSVLRPALARTEVGKPGAQVAGMVAQCSCRRSFVAGRGNQS